jgi:GntR family transcriptional regulator
MLNLRLLLVRGTVRSALAELAQRDLIATQSGVGSFVTFDGVALDQSLGWATVPATGVLADLPERGLVNDSLTATLAEAGLHASGGEQWIGLESLDAEAAALLERGAGEPFLRAVRISTDTRGRLIEHVVSLLDPARFRFHLTSGAR